MFRVGTSTVIGLVLCVLTAACGGAVGCRSFGFGAEPAQNGAARGAGPVADPTAPPPRPKIVALGDSLTAGYGLVESASYPSLLQQRLDKDGYSFEVVNAGVSGDTSAGGLRRLDWALEGD